MTKKMSKKTRVWWWKHLATRRMWTWIARHLPLALQQEPHLFVTSETARTTDGMEAPADTTMDSVLNYFWRRRWPDEADGYIEKMERLRKTR